MSSRVPRISCLWGRGLDWAQACRVLVKMCGRTYMEPRIYIIKFQCSDELLFPFGILDLAGYFRTLSFHFLSATKASSNLGFLVSPTSKILLRSAAAKPPQALKIWQYGWFSSNRGSTYSERGLQLASVPRSVHSCLRLSAVSAGHRLQDYPTPEEKASTV